MTSPVPSLPTWFACPVGRAGNVRKRSAGQLGQHLTAERLDPLGLVPADVVEVDAVNAEVEIALDVGAVGVQVARDEHPPREVTGADQPGHLLEVVRGADVLLGEPHSAVRPLGDRVAHGFLVGGRPRQVQLEDLDLRSGLAASLLGPGVESLEQPGDLLGRGTGRDDPVRQPARLLRGHRPGGGDIDGRRALWHRPQPRGLHLVIGAPVPDVLAGEELADELDRLPHPVKPLRCLGPVAGGHVLVQRLPRAQPEPVPPRVHRRQRRRCLRHDRRVEPEGRARYPRAEIAPGPLPHGGQHVPHERRVSLRRHPRLEMVGRHDPPESCRLGCDRIFGHLDRAELLEHRGVTDVRQAHACPPGSGITTPVDSHSASMKAVNAAQVEALRALLAPSGWLERTQDFARALRGQTRTPHGLLVVGTPGYEPWHLAAHLADESRLAGLPELTPTLVRWSPAAGGPPHLRVGIDRIERAGRAETVLVVAPEAAPAPLLERVAGARKAGAAIFALDRCDEELDGLAHESLAVRAELDPVSFDGAQHLVSLAAREAEGLASRAGARARPRRGDARGTLARLLDAMSGSRESEGSPY